MLNLEYLKDRMNQISPKSEEKTINYVTFEEGKSYDIRFLPLENGSFCEEFWIYYGIANQFFRCTFKNNKPDPVHEKHMQLMTNAQYRNDKKFMKPFIPKLKCVAPVIIRGQEDKGVQVFTFTEYVYSDIIRIFLDEKYNNAVDPVHGYDVRCHVSRSDKGYLRYKFQPATQSSGLNMDLSVLKESMPDLELCYTEYDPAKMQELVDNYVNTNMAFSGPNAWNPGNDSWKNASAVSWDAEKIKPF